MPQIGMNQIDMNNKYGILNARRLLYRLIKTDKSIRLLTYAMLFINLMKDTKKTTNV